MTHDNLQLAKLASSLIRFIASPLAATHVLVQSLKNMAAYSSSNCQRLQTAFTLTDPLVTTLLDVLEENKVSVGPLQHVGMWLTLYRELLDAHLVHQDGPRSRGKGRSLRSLKYKIWICAQPPGAPPHFNFLQIHNCGVAVEIPSGVPVLVPAFLLCRGGLDIDDCKDFPELVKKRVHHAAPSGSTPRAVGQLRKSLRIFARERQRGHVAYRVAPY